MDEKRYVSMRKKLLSQMQKLVYDRTKINNEIRKARQEMESWDRALLSEE